MNKNAGKWLIFIILIIVTAAAIILLLFYADWRKQPEPDAAVAERNTSDTNENTRNETTENEPDEISSEQVPVVYMTTDISPEGLMNTYRALEWEPSGKVAVKLSTGEPPASNYLEPSLIGNLVEHVDGTIVECNTAYGGSRAETGILASTDPVALDQACIDLVYAAEDGEALIQRIESRNGLHTLEYAQQIGLGSRAYELVNLDD